MMRRLAGAMVMGLMLLVSPAVAAAQSSPPPASLVPSTAPSELVAMLPTQIGDVELVTRTYTGTEALAATDEANRAAMLEMLEGWGKGPDDYELVMANVADESATEAHVVIAMRVTGVTAETLLEGMIWVSQARHDRTPPPDYQLLPEVVGDRAIYASPAIGPTYSFMYPYEDVLFAVYGLGEVSRVEALNALP